LGDGSPNRVRGILTILRFYELELDSVQFDVSSITKDIDRPLDLSWINVNLLEVFKLPVMDFVPITKYEDIFYISSKGGPNGAPAFAQWHHDARGLMTDWKLYTLWKRFTRRVGKFILTKRLGMDFPQMVMDKGREGSVHSKLAFLSDKAGKTRVVAMLDV